MNKPDSKLAKSLLAAAMLVATSAQIASADDTALRNAERRIAQCLDHAASNQFHPLAIGVLDASGTLVAFKRQDGASAATADAALLKAKTALRLNAPTAVLGPDVADDAATRETFVILQLTTLAGGEPLSDAAGRVAGAVGASGGSAEQDAECARRAAAAALPKAP